MLTHAQFFYKVRIHVLRYMFGHVQFMYVYM